MEDERAKGKEEVNGGGKWGEEEESSRFSSEKERKKKKTKKRIKILAPGRIPRLGRLPGRVASPKSTS